MLSNPEWEKKQLFDLSKPSLQALSYALRHKELWPAGFEWDFWHCDHCAMGLAFELWKEFYPVDKPQHQYHVSEVLNINTAQIAKILWGDGPWVPTTHNGELSVYKVTPEMVADQIDLHLANA